VQCVPGVQAPGSGWRDCLVAANDHHEGNSGREREVPHSPPHDAVERGHGKLDELGPEAAGPAELHKRARQ
jgi:hypothetical protein